MNRIVWVAVPGAVLAAAGAFYLMTGRIADRSLNMTIKQAAVGQPAATAAHSPSLGSSETSVTESGPNESGGPPPVRPMCAGTPTTEAAEFTGGAPSATYCEGGHLVPGSGTGDTDTTDWAPNMRFPLDRAPAYANSQVWGVGGTSGPRGSQGDLRNYSYPWHDDFCEARAYATVICPSGKGHQGQDIRPAQCCDAGGRLLQDTFVVDAVEDGQITSIGSYTVYLTGESGRLYRYLHMDMKRLMVQDGDRVTRGQHIGYVSNYFGSSVTTFHLHFEIKTAVRINNRSVYTWVSPYPSLITSYASLLQGKP